MTHTREDRITGCLLGGALGDAVGAFLEGSGPTTDFKVPSELAVTDDTQLTLATCEAIIECRAVSPEAVADRFVRWYREQRLTGIGASTLKALTELDAGGHWALVGATGERSAGNGAAMRIAPLAFFLNPDIDSSRQVVRDVCRITHRNDEAYIGAMALLRAIRHVCANGELDGSLVRHLLDTLPDSRVRDRFLAIENAALTPDEYVDRYAASGYVVDSVPLAILAATYANDVIEMIRRIVTFGGDTDTNASMFGQVFGAAHGARSLPIDLVKGIDAADLVWQRARELSSVPVGE